MNGMNKFCAKILILTLSASLLLVSKMSQQSNASEYIFETPKVLDFTVSKDSIEIVQDNPELSFNLKISHPIGIASTKTRLWFISRDKKFEISTELFRQPSESKNLATFTGNLKLNTILSPGIYDFYADPIEGLSNKSGLPTPRTDIIYPSAFNKFPDAERSVLVRLAGELNLNNKTFVGPTYSSNVRITDDQPIVFSSESPIFRVGEFYDPIKYFNKRVQSLALKISSSTPTTCIQDSNKLKFISVGNCSFTVFTEKNADYLRTSISLSVEIATARVKPTITLPIVTSQTSISLPKVVNLNLVYNTAGEIVIPKTLSPTVCVPSGLSSVTIISGGTCNLLYQSMATNTLLDSDIYPLTFEITRSIQTISFAPPTTVKLSANSIALFATASSGGAITFTVASPDTCSVTGNTLNLLKSGNCVVHASQTGGATIAPISKTATVIIAGSDPERNIICFAGKKSKNVSGLNPKCPKGYKLKR